jgi:histidyl-tRNA synthetase
MFRYERPQKGRQRQFHQLGVELIGAANSWADIECIALADAILKKLETRQLTTLEINSIGDSESRSKYRDELVKYLSAFETQLSADSQKRLKTNPLRILDSKDEKDQKIRVANPCGKCRELLIDYAPDTYVIIRDEDNQLKKERARNLIPNRYKK